ncbi:hypothetical protein FA13DRAFT_1740988 [Coprinellus micaceus]|uniref:Uncharacterized protein n=1 Tax=Coprinellus micaceus TaxID=71717 RepID=A0A4Y7SKM8_COPMI|nr:hypothetical protein FA13DRAFT_1740988 [Coprinellus micaceus]
MSCTPALAFQAVTPTPHRAYSCKAILNPPATPQETTEPGRGEHGTGPDGGWEVWSQTRECTTVRRNDRESSTQKRTRMKAKAEVRKQAMTPGRTPADL